MVAHVVVKLEQMFYTMSRTCVVEAGTPPTGRYFCKALWEIKAFVREERSI
jgi:hypothetical protein